MKAIITTLVVCFVVKFDLCAQVDGSITVAKDGSGTFASVQQAFEAVPVNNKREFTILVKKGVYKERLVLDSTKAFVRLVGEDAANTILTFDNHSGRITPEGDTITTYSSASFFILGNDFSAENITFENNAGFTAGQAVAVFAFGDRLKFKSCRFLGFQDVLLCSGVASRQYFEKCYIEGTTDFIFGPSTALFINCHIHSKKNSHVTAASTPKNVPYGFVFIDCKLTADEGLDKVSLGRPWRPYASVTYIRCDIGEHIFPEGWNNWRNPENEKTARFTEYQNTGPGANRDTRFKWIKQLSESDAMSFTIKNIFGDWDPNRSL